MTEEAVILAGGLGTRLRGAVPDLPKPMAPVAGRPFLSWLLDHLAGHGVRRAVLSVGYRREAIMDRFGSRHGALALDYAVEETPLGTGGGIALGLAQIEGPAAFVLNGDTFLDLDYRHFDVAAGASSTMAIALRRIDEADRYGAAIVQDGRVVGFAARAGGGPGRINAGVYRLPRDLFSRFEMPAAFSFERDFLEVHAAALKPLAYDCDGMFIDIGVPEAWRQAQRVFAERVAENGAV